MLATERKLVLVVDDEPKIVRMLRELLESSGYEVQTESCGTAALDYAKEHQPDLVILDLRLPDLSGFEVSEQLRQVYDHATLPILMLTAMDRAEDREHGLECGADVYMSKPVGLGELLEQVQLLLSGAGPNLA